MNLDDAGPVTHLVPPDGMGGVTPCCGRTPFELPRMDRMTATASRSDCRGLEGSPARVRASLSAAGYHPCRECGSHWPAPEGHLCRDCRRHVALGAAVVAGCAAGLAVFGAFMLWWWFR